MLAGLASARTGSINGYVRDATNGEPLSYANVFLDGTGLGAASNDRGYYYISSVPAGDYELAVSYVGYGTKRQRVQVEASATTTIDVSLDPGSVRLDEVIVSAERARFEREVELSATRLDTRQLLTIPKVGGEMDLFRAIQMLPGVIATSDFSNRLYIRGGSPDQNLILLDGITIYNPSHLFGMYSPFITEAIADATLLAGGFPAEYGGRLSAVLDITTKEGNSKTYTGHGSLSVLAGEALAEGPIPNGSFLVAGRRTWLPDALLNALGADGLGYYFYDLMGKANYELNHDVRLTLAGLGAEDVLNFWDPEARDSFNGRLAWGNRGLSGQANLILSPVLYCRTTAAWSNFFSDFRVAFNETDTARMTTDLTDFTLKSDLTWYLHNRHTLALGADLKMTGTRTTTKFDTISFTNRDTLWPLSAYVDDKWEVIPDRFFIKPGLRYSFYSNGNRHELEPRFGLKYKTGKNTALNASAGRYTQPMVTLNSTEAIFSIYDMWVPVPDDRQIPSALHYIAGVEHWLTGDAILEVEGWYKDYADLLEVRYGDFATQPESLLTADGYSCGCDLMLRKTEGWVTGWVGYSWMWTRRNIGEEVYHPHYDRRHNLNVVANFPTLFLGMDVSANFTFGTGLPYAGDIAYFPRYEYLPGENEVQYSWEFIQGPRDAFRYPLYHRLDAGLSKTWNMNWGEISAFLDVTNLYYARNVLLYYWEADDGEFPVRKQLEMMPILPSIGLKVRF